MEFIKNRKQIEQALPALLNGLDESNQHFLNELQLKILNNKVSFPILEHFTSTILKKIDPKLHLLLAIEIMKLNGMGKYVICGQLLRQRLEVDFLGSISTALGFIRQGDEWRACDLIAERVIGNSILNNPVETLAFAKATILSPTKWDKRAIGVAIHYAVKKGLPKSYAEQSFQILLSMAYEKDLHSKTGVGWAAKTISKFHPDLAIKYKDQIQEASRWFKTKVQMGQARAAFYQSTIESLTPASQV